MQVIFDVFWLMGESASLMLVAYGASLVFTYQRRASHPLLQAVAALAMNDALQRGAMLAASKETATAN